MDEHTINFLAGMILILALALAEAIEGFIAVYNDADEFDETNADDLHLSLLAKDEID